MSCSTYDELTNGLKMIPVGLALGAIAWFVAGTGVKEGYEKRRREREREVEDRRKDEAKERREREADERKAERERERREYESQKKRVQYASLNYGRLVA